MKLSPTTLYCKIRVLRKVRISLLNVSLIRETVYQGKSEQEGKYLP